MTPDGCYVLTADTNSQAFYRTGIKTGDVEQIDLGGVSDISADGLLLREGMLFSISSLLRPEGDDLLVDNFQYQSTEPNLPFTVVQVRLRVY